MMRKPSTDDYSEAETIERREAAVKRMLATPHQPHRPLGKKKPKRHSKRKPAKPGR